jgi:flavin reductase (DIM6/NTAB) family NADH-FMN oxidoreductase RutF
MVEQDVLRKLFGSFASGVTVVTCRSADGLPHGTTMTSFVVVSMDPPLVQVTPMRTSRICGYLSEAPFAVNVLSSHQADVALHFAGRPNLGEIDWVDGATAPMLAGTTATICCVPWREYDGGDHTIVIGEIVDAVVTDRPPLTYYRRQFHELGRSTADAHWSGSSDDPFAGWFGAMTSFDSIRSK